MTFQRNIVHRHIAKLHYLHTIAFEVSHLEPAANEIMQRVLATEMHIYCPSLRRVVFCFGQSANLWVLHQETWTQTGARPSTYVEDHIWLSV